MKQYRIIQGMRRNGDYWDTAPKGPFIRGLKYERLSDCRFTARMAANTAVLEYISYSNSSRHYSLLGIEVHLHTGKNNADWRPNSRSPLFLDYYNRKEVYEYE